MVADCQTVQRGDLKIITQISLYRHSLLVINRFDVRTMCAASNDVNIEHTVFTVRENEGRVITLWGLNLLMSIKLIAL